MFKAFSATASATATGSVDLDGVVNTFSQSAEAPGFSYESTDDAIKNAQTNANIIVEQAVQEYTELIINSNSRVVNWVNYNYIPFTVSDGAILYYYYQPAKIEKKRTLLCIPGWAASPDSFSPIISTNSILNNYYDIYILTMRGYNLQPQISGNNVPRYSADVKEFIESKNLTDITTMTHSMGCSVIWDFIGLYSEKYFKNYLLIDQGPVIYKNPRNTEEENLKLGSTFDSAQLFEYTNTLIYDSKEAGDALKIEFAKTMFTPEFVLTRPAIMQDIYEGTINYYNITSGQVLFNTVCLNQINDVLNAGINNPALLIGGIYSVVPYQSIIYQTKYYKEYELHIFDRPQGGSHFMFVENPELMNEYINTFLGKYDPL